MAQYQFTTMHSKRRVQVVIVSLRLQCLYIATQSMKMSMMKTSPYFDNCSLETFLTLK